MALFQKYCLCGQPYDICKFMIQCDHCKEWFHGSCVFVKEYESRDIEKFHCPRCQPSAGSSIMKERKNWHRHDYWDSEATLKPIQSGTAVFVRELKQRTFPLADEEVVVVRGQHLTLPYFVQNGFDRPILIPSKDGLGLLMPPDSFTVNDIMDYVGEDCVLDAIDVGRQEDIKMTMKDWVTYYNSPERDKIYNVISLEFSNNRLSDLVRPPSIVQKLSWVESFWPDPSSALAKKLENQDNSPIRPQVMKYCLMGTEDSYTDFHIDFGGTSVWYHILQGEKIFYLIRPSPENLEKYEKWMLSPNQSETFFGDLVDVCYKLVITRGQTLFIPSGWIHAVITPVDSMVFGGNFLCSMNIPLQLKVHEMEGRIKTPHKYKFPSFEDVHWYAAPNIAQHLRDFNEGNRRAPAYLLQGAKTIANLLKSWLNEKEEKRKFPPPHGLNPQKIIKDLGREVRMAERQLTVKGRADREKRLKDLISTPVKTRKPLLRRSVQPLTPKISNIEPTEINVLNESNVLESSHSKHDETEIINSNSPVVDEEKSTPHKTVVPVSPSKASSLSGNVGRTFATTNAARRKAAAANRSNALKMKLSAEGKSPLKDTSHVVTQKQMNSSKNPEQKDSVYDFVDSDEDTLVVDEKPKGKRKGISPVVQAVSCDIPNNSVSIGINGNFKQRMIARNEQNKASPAIVTTSEGLPIARKSAPGPPVPALKLPSQTSPTTLPDHTAHGTLRLKLSINGAPSSDDHYHQLQPLREVNSDSFNIEQDNSFNQTESPSSVGSKNGGTLDTLLLACDYAGDPESSRISMEDDLSNSGRASPSTREAIQGMLSMSKSAFTFGAQNLKETSSPSSTYMEVSSSNNLSSLMDSRLMGLSLLASKCTTNSSPPSSPSFHTRSPAIGMRGMTQVGSRIGTRSIIGKRKFPKEEDDFEASLKNCHQDKDFIYFDLDTTEEDQNIFKRRGGRATHDESWSPRARVNISCPKPERPSREGARKEAIESGLAAAAAKLADLPPPKRPYHRKKPSHPPPKKEVVEEFTNPSTSSGSALVISTTVKKAPSGDSSPPQSLGGRKPRKGFATAKQRLGKILKIHKMLH